MVYFLLAIKRVPSLILAQSQVSAPLNSQPVTGYREGGATPIRSSFQSGDYIVLHIDLLVGLHVGYVRVHCHCSLTVYL